MNNEHVGDQFWEDLRAFMADVLSPEYRKRRVIADEAARKGRVPVATKQTKCERRKP